MQTVKQNNKTEVAFSVIMKRLLLLLSTLFIVNCEIKDYEECFKIDSISCLQMQIFQTAKSLLNQKSIDIFSGISITQDGDSVRQEKSSSPDSLAILEEDVKNANDPIERNAAIGDYLVRKARDVMLTKSVSWNVGETVRALTNIVPEDIRVKINDLVVEGRGKRKKLMKLLMPALLGLKLKMAIVTLLSFLGIGLLAKKALFAAAVSLLISGYIGIKKLMAQQHQNHYNHHHHGVGYEETYHATPTLGYAPSYGASYGGSYHDSEPSGNHLAYSAHKSV